MRYPPSRMRPAYRFASTSGIPAPIMPPTSPPVAPPAPAPARAATIGPAATRGPIPGMASAPIPTSHPRTPPTGRPSSGASRRTLRSLGVDFVCEILCGAIPLRQDGGDVAIPESCGAKCLERTLFAPSVFESFRPYPRLFHAQQFAAVVHPPPTVLNSCPHPRMIRVPCQSALCLPERRLK